MLAWYDLGFLDVVVLLDRQHFAGEVLEADVAVHVFVEPPVECGHVAVQQVKTVCFEDLLEVIRRNAVLVRSWVDPHY